MPVARARRVRLHPGWYVLVLSGMCLLAGCRFPTKVYGRVTLKPGEAGDVRLARVELRDSAAWDSVPVYTVTPESGGTFFRASFEFPAVTPGPYYLLAWQDRNADGKLSDGDLTGVFGGPTEPGRPGKSVMVYESWTVNAGDIEMAAYEVLEVNAAGTRSTSRESTSFTYSFNHDVLLNTLALTFPGQTTLPDPEAAGPKFADSTYASGGWSMGGQMPTGLHQLEFRGTFKDSSFTLRVAVPVQ
jgi:hypothetical protein